MLDSSMDRSESRTDSQAQKKNYKDITCNTLLYKTKLGGSLSQHLQTKVFFFFFEEQWLLLLCEGVRGAVGITGLVVIRDVTSCLNTPRDSSHRSAVTKCRSGATWKWRDFSALWNRPKIRIQKIRFHMSYVVSHCHEKKSNLSHKSVCKSEC